MAHNERSGKVQTVLGPIDPADLGITMTHEHLLVDLGCYVERPPEASRRAYLDAPVTMEMLNDVSVLQWVSYDNLRLYDISTAIEEVSEYAHAGGRSLVDTTSISIGRDPLGLAKISRATGLNIVMGGSYYLPTSHPPDMDERSEDSIAEQIARDVTEGVGDTGIRSGVIGEVGNGSPLGANEHKVLRASARAQAETGAPISIHPGGAPGAKKEIVDILASSGADPTHVIIGHLDSLWDRDELKRLAETGCYLEYDIFGWENTTLEWYKPILMMSDGQRIDTLEYLIDEGHLPQILIAQDICQKWHLKRFGGRTYAHILNVILPRMRRRGFTEEHMQAMLVDNPARALTFA